MDLYHHCRTNRKPGATDGIGSDARFNWPIGIAVDPQGDLLVSDFFNHNIRKITPAGGVSTLAGLAGTTGSSDGAGTNARFRNPLRFAVDRSGNAYMTEYNNHTIRKITPAGMVSTLAGQAGSIGSADGLAVNARFNLPDGLAITSEGDILVVDEGNNTIRKIATHGVVSTVAGHARAKGSMDGPGPAARFNRPTGIAQGAHGFIYVTDAGNNTIRVINPSGVVSTLAGQPGVAGSADGLTTNARFHFPVGIAADGEGNLYVTDAKNHTIRKIASTGVVTTIGGLAGTVGSDDGGGPEARFSGPEDPALDTQGNIYITDPASHTIRKGVRHPAQKPAGTTTTVAPVPSTTPDAQPPPQATATNPAASNEPDWISPELPKPGDDGWIVLFDGKRLYGRSPPIADIASGKLSIQDGRLRLDSISLVFNLIGRDMEDSNAPEKGERFQLQCWCSR